MFDNVIYAQLEGLAMGSPLSPLLAEIFMNNFEIILLKSRLALENIIYWYRYVDDILIGWQGTNRQLDQFLHLANSIHPKIKFTMELEVDSTINFLDLSITNKNNAHEFKIYRKPTYSDITIHKDSSHPLQHKYAAYNSMIHRLFTIPLDTSNFNLEVQYIKQIAVNNGFDIETINKLINRKYHKLAIKEIYCASMSSEYDSSVLLPYYNNISVKIGNLITKNNHRPIAFKTVSNIGKQLCVYFSPTESKSGVYKLNCNSCNACYIGQTGRSFKQRISEHKSSFKNKKSNSTFANHLLETGHTSNFIPDILHFEKKGFKLHLLESLEIKKHLNQTFLCLNEQTSLYNSPLIEL